MPKCSNEIIYFIVDYLISIWQNVDDIKYSWVYTLLSNSWVQNKYQAISESSKL